MKALCIAALLALPLPAAAVSVFEDGVVNVFDFSPAGSPTYALDTGLNFFQGGLDGMCIADGECNVDPGGDTENSLDVFQLTLEEGQRLTGIQFAPGGLFGPTSDFSYDASITNVDTGQTLGGTWGFETGFMLNTVRAPLNLDWTEIEVRVEANDVMTLGAFSAYSVNYEWGFRVEGSVTDVSAVAVPLGSSGLMLLGAVVAAAGVSRRGVRRSG
ncbi:MAG: hypothetical protein AAF281_03415 [Pseudomonadota bacterium]